ncbi:hypothetical protein [Streptomyces sp. NPDC008137]|uniref:hypothetical protein n=1 Tax=Streptomyces sp. NPDC008137 TaxID=3364813 RepID=UPI0036DFB859
MTGLRRTVEGFRAAAEVRASVRDETPEDPSRRADGRISTVTAFRPGVCDTPA